MLNKGREEGGGGGGEEEERGGEWRGRRGEGISDIHPPPHMHACTHEHTQSVTLRNTSSDMTPFLRASLR